MLSWGRDKQGVGGIFVRKNISLLILLNVPYKLLVEEVINFSAVQAEYDSLFWDHILQNQARLIIVNVNKLSQSTLILWQ